MTTFLTIYFFGFIFTYITLRLCDKFIDKKIWTKETRAKALVISIGSWLAFLITLYYVVKEYSDDSPASW